MLIMFNKVKRQTVTHYEVWWRYCLTQSTTADFSAGCGCGGRCGYGCGGWVWVGVGVLVGVEVCGGGGGRGRRLCFISCHRLQF